MSAPVALDPRTDEVAARADLARKSASAFSIGVVVAQGAFLPGNTRAGRLPAIQIIALATASEERPYATFEAVRQDDGLWTAYQGHYDMTWAEAVADLADRAPSVATQTCSSCGHCEFVAASQAEQDSRWLCERCV